MLRFAEEKAMGRVSEVRAIPLPVERGGVRGGDRTRAARPHPRPFPALRGGEKTRVVLSVAMAMFAIIASRQFSRAEDINDYPTSARADYVFACMKANGETQEILQKCSCSIDVIASVIPYDRYVSAETILSMSQVTGPVGSEFRSTEQAKATMQEFRRAQAEAEVRCF